MLNNEMLDADSHWTEAPDMFTTRAPAKYRDHPACLYPKPLESVAGKLSTLPEETRRNILGEHARKLYRL